MNSQNEKEPIKKKVDETWKETAKKEKEEMEVLETYL